MEGRKKSDEEAKKKGRITFGVAMPIHMICQKKLFKPRHAQGQSVRAPSNSVFAGLGNIPCRSSSHSLSNLIL
jgi:hypothetical protein